MQLGELAHTMQELLQEEWGEEDFIFDALIRDTLPTLRPAWMRHAACRGESADLFFPGAGHPATRKRRVAAAKEICAGCPVRQECLDAALAVGFADDWGIWGGMTRDERSSMPRKVRDPREWCRYGHPVDRAGACKACRRDQNRRSSERRREAGDAASEAPLICRSVKRVR